MRAVTGDMRPAHVMTGLSGPARDRAEYRDLFYRCLDRNAADSRAERWHCTHSPRPSPSLSVMLVGHRHRSALPMLGTNGPGVAD